MVAPTLRPVIFTYWSITFVGYPSSREPLAFTTMSDLPPLKRQRTDDAQKDTETQRSRFWFDDGNVILQTENTQFRVHRSLLSLHSNVFNDMFSVPQPTDTTTIPDVDGCPVIPLSDKTSDLEHILSIFYENIR